MRILAASRARGEEWGETLPHFSLNDIASLFLAEEMSLRKRRVKAVIFNKFGTGISK
jgi:hypothetical protein